LNNHQIDKVEEILKNASKFLVEKAFEFARDENRLAAPFAVNARLSGLNYFGGFHFISFCLFFSV